MIYGLILSTVLGGAVPSVPAQANDCLTKHGVTHCWERLGEWDPRPAPWEWLFYQNTMPDAPKDWGEYATEKR